VPPVLSEIARMTAIAAATTVAAAAITAGFRRDRRSRIAGRPVGRASTAGGLVAHAPADGAPVGLAAEGGGLVAQSPAGTVPVGRTPDGGEPVGAGPPSADSSAGTAGRSCGALAWQPPMTWRSRSSATPARSGGSVKMRNITVAAESSPNGARPVAANASTLPSANTSLAGPTGSPRIC
jgi:hypothetical protein